MNKRRKLPTIDDIRDLWLQKYHNTNTKELVEKLPEEVRMSPKWFELYPCTQEQYNEWVIEAKAYLKKHTKWGNHYINRSWPFISLDAAPYVAPNLNDNV